MTRTPFISRQWLFNLSVAQQVKLSPLGNYVSFLKADEEGVTLWVAPLTLLNAPFALVKSSHALAYYEWMPKEDYIVFSEDSEGKENWQLKSIALKTRKIRSYTDTHFHMQLLAISPLYPHTLLIALNKRDPHYHDVYRLEITSGQLDCIYENNEYWYLVADEHLQLRIGIKVGKEGGEYFILSQKGQAQFLTFATFHDLYHLYFYPFLQRQSVYCYQDTFFYLDSMQTPTLAWAAINLNTKQKWILGYQEKADICETLCHPVTKMPLAFAVNYTRKSWHSLTPAVAKEIAFLQQSHQGDLEICNQTQDNQKWLVKFVQDKTLPAFYCYDRRTQILTALFSQSAVSFPLTALTPYVITARDGLKCVSFLSLPFAIEQKNGIPLVPLPLVLWVHGGPYYRDRWEYQVIHQWLTSRGYAVLSVNYRGSTGFGKIHTQASKGEWGAKMQTDLIDAVTWAIEQGIAQKEKVAIMGRSFGGYATLMALSKTPDIFCCGVDLMGPTNLETLFKHVPPYWKTMEEALYQGVGCDPRTPAGKIYLQSRSPLTYAQQINKPLLIGHGSKDVQVTQQESEAIVAILEKNHIPVTYVVFPDEGHQLVKSENRLAFYGLVEAFLAKNLGGEYEISKKVQKSRMEIKKDDFGLDRMIKKREE